MYAEDAAKGAAKAGSRRQIRERNFAVVVAYDAKTLLTLLWFRRDVWW